MMKVGIVTQARTASTRLPAKVLIEVGGRTLLEHHLDRLEASGLGVYVATTTDVRDDEIVRIATDRGFTYHRGSELDVLARFHECAAENDLDVVVRVTSDCPLVDGGLIAAGVAEYVAANDMDMYLSNTLVRTYPRGFDFEVFSATALKDAHCHATGAADREHVTPYLRRNANGRMTFRSVLSPVYKADYRVTLDTTEDLELIRRLIEEHHAERLGITGIVDVLDRHPELVALNRHVEQKKPGE